MGIGAMQLMLDRGQDQDWFSSSEIVTEAVLAGLGIYLFLVHMVWARQPLIRPEVFRDVNFSSGLAMMFAVGTLLVSSLALMTPWLQVLSNYPVETAGLVMAPRGHRQPGDDHAQRAAVQPGRCAAAGRHRIADDLPLVLADDRLDARRVGARDHHRDRHPGRRHGAGVHAAAGVGVRHAAAGDAHRGRVAVQPAAQHRRGDRRLGDLVVAGA